MLSDVDFGLKLHHSGLVVPDLSKALEFWHPLIGWEKTPSVEYVPSQQVNICLIPQGRGDYLELIEPVGVSSPVYDFAQQGGGFHHLCYETHDMEKSIYLMTRQRFRLFVKPVVGFEQRSTAFLMSRIEGCGAEIVELATLRPW